MVRPGRQGALLLPGPRQPVQTAVYFLINGELGEGRLAPQPVEPQQRWLAIVIVIRAAGTMGQAGPQ